jgi:hypothetical protein
MPIFLASLLSFELAFSGAAQTPPQGTTPRGGITDSHEGMTISVDPWTQPSQYKEKFPKKSPLSGGVVALRVSFRNTSDQSIKVELRRMRLLVTLDEENRQELEPLTAEDVADTVLLSKENGKDPTARRNPLPIPVGKPRTSRDANWTNFKDACQNAAVPSSVVAARESVEGLIYFDLRGEVELLKNAHLYIPNLVTMNDNHPLLYFDIDLGHSSSN